MNKFKELGIEDSILNIIEEEGFTEPTEIQAGSIPYAIKGQDIIGGAATGSGKTLAFGAGIIQNAKKGKGVQALVLCPTRELAVQVTKELKKFSKNKGLHVLSIYGGVGINPQIAKLPKTDIVVGTPGRVLDHMSRRTIDLSNVKTLVLDEADRMFDMGFRDDVEKIIRGCPKEKQMLLFSATINDDVYRICKKYLNDAKKVSVESQVDPKKLKQVYYDVDEHLKFSLLVHLLKKEKGDGLVMIFCNTQRSCSFIANNLKGQGIKAIAIHGGFSQAKRNKTMEDFHNQDFQVLVCTDVAARGLDIKGVTHVYNYDIPNDPKQYVHRIGRTARAGENGEAINIISDRDHMNFSNVFRECEVEIEKMETPRVERVNFTYKERPQRRFGGRGQGHRGGGQGRGRSGGNRRGPPRHRRR